MASFKVSGLFFYDQVTHDQVVKKEHATVQEEDAEQNRKSACAAVLALFSRRRAPLVLWSVAKFFGFVPSLVGGALCTSICFFFFYAGSVLLFFVLLGAVFVGAIGWDFWAGVFSCLVFFVFVLF